MEQKICDMFKFQLLGDLRYSFTSLNPLLSASAARSVPKHGMEKLTIQCTMILQCNTVPPSYKSIVGKKVLHGTLNV